MLLTQPQLRQLCKRKLDTDDQPAKRTKIESREPKTLPPSRMKCLPHGTRRDRCQPCGAKPPKPRVNVKCFHEIIKYNCSECNPNKPKHVYPYTPAKKCPHEKRRSHCIICSGSALCADPCPRVGMLKAYCWWCDGSQLCRTPCIRAGKEKVNCPCCGTGRKKTRQPPCPHGKRSKYLCSICDGRLLCGSDCIRAGLEKRFCKQCDGSSLCAYPCANEGKRKVFCSKCDGTLLCAGNCTYKAIVARRGDFCAVCVPRARTNSRFKEAQISGFLNEWHEADIIPDFVWNRQNPSADPVQCGRYRPDFIWLTNACVVVVEVDETQHKHYDRRCELVRMMEISLGYGGAPVHWIRYNPDAFKVDGVTREMKRQERVDILRARLLSALAAPDFEHLITIEYLFYDTPGLPGLAPAGEDIGADGEVQMVRLAGVGAFHAWCASAGVSVD